jgi:hypothetical protein
MISAAVARLISKVLLLTPSPEWLARKRFSNLHSRFRAATSESDPGCVKTPPML